MSPRAAAKPRPAGSALLAAALLLAGCAEMPPAAVRARIEAGWDHPLAYRGPDEVTIPLTRGKDNKLYFPIRVNGHEIEVALDTGARTIFDLPTLRTFGLAGYPATGPFWGFGGTVRVHAGYVDELDLGGLKIEGLSVVMADLADLKNNQLQAGLPLVGGLIGADLLAPLSAQIDYERNTLTLRRPPARTPPPDQPPAHESH